MTGCKPKPSQITYPCRHRPPSRFWKWCGISGPLRENIDDVLARIDAIIINGPFLGRRRTDVDAVISKAGEVNIPVFETELVATNTHAEKAVAFAALDGQQNFTVNLNSDMMFNSAKILMIIIIILSRTPQIYSHLPNNITRNSSRPVKMLRLKV